MPCKMMTHRMEASPSTTFQSPVERGVPCKITNQIELLCQKPPAHVSIPCRAGRALQAIELRNTGTAPVEVFQSPVERGVPCKLPPNRHRPSVPEANVSIPCRAGRALQVMGPYMLWCKFDVFQSPVERGVPCKLETETEQDDG